MSKSVETSPFQQPHSVEAHARVKRIASAAADLSERHAAQFANLAALARTLQTVISASKVKLDDYAQLARALVDCAEQYKEQADLEDIALSIIATDTQFLLDDEARAAVLGSRSRRVKVTGETSDHKVTPVRKAKVVRKSSARLREQIITKFAEPTTATTH
ncbi:hypothetical protein PQQ52_15500 [Paraburkholderia sediminicola]|uniref:hypothetical protein n=1 Tax=Paraburkholderia sediminicola TaxID=458836 RepID=UPI0038BB5D83